MDEAWSYIPGVEAESVQLTDLPEVKQLDNAEAVKEKWAALMEVREDVLKALEEAREDKVIGKSLEALVTIVPKNEKNLCNLKRNRESASILYCF